LVGMPMGLVAAPVAGLAAFRAPDFILATRARKRWRQLDGEVPQLLDALAAACGAGLSGWSAVERCLPALRGPLGEELAAALAAVSLGGRWNVELDLLCRRFRLPDLTRLSNAMNRTRSLGVSLADVVGELAADVRASRASAVAERSRKAPVKMLFPLVFMILP